MVNLFRFEIVIVGYVLKKMTFIHIQMSDASKEKGTSHVNEKGNEIDLFKIMCIVFIMSGNSFVGCVI